VTFLRFGRRRIGLNRQVAYLTPITYIVIGLSRTFGASTVLRFAPKSLH